MQTITPSELHTRSQRESVELIDVRTPAEFGEVHAQIARNIPLDKLYPNELKESRKDAHDKPLYVICKSGARGEKALKQLSAAGFPHVVNVEGGTDAWVAANLPVLRGKKAISLDRQMRIVAGSLVIIGVVLGFLVHRYFFSLSAFVGAGLVMAGVTNICPMINMLAKMPWNQA
jgi:rhodanese-related sulfurtransferase